MRRIVIAPSFDAEFFEISLSIERAFGARIADKFDARFQHIATTLAHAPLIGSAGHGYPTGLYGFVMSPSWVFYRFNDDEIVFLHIRDGRMNTDEQLFLDDV